jgi:serine/threonine protein kinase
LGPYEVTGLLGRGGMGEVYRAHDTRLDRTVAVKVLPPESMRNAERVLRFEQEAKAASGRNHPNILTIYDFGATDGTYYMAMEFVEGHTLRQIIQKGATQLPRALDIAGQCASGLAAAHAAGIIHRDIKPDNIMVRPDGFVKILDFGLAKLAENPLATADPNALTAAPGLTAPGLIIGTWLYMSPEQARGQELDARTDIWSLGAVLYEMVAGKSPFAARTMSDTLASILNREPDTLSSYGVDVPEELKHILSKAMAKDREERYQSIKDMELDLVQLRRELESGRARNRGMEAASPERESREKAGGSLRSNGSGGMSAGRKMSLLGVSSVLAIALLVWAMVANRPGVTPAPPVVPAAAPVAVADRQLSYALLVQKMREGKPYQGTFAATGREIFENGWKVQFDFSIPQAGSLYLLNDGPGADGKPELSIVFPTPSVNNGSAQVLAYKNVQSGWLRFNDQPGREKFWVVWAIKPVPELEQAVQQAFKAMDARIRDPQLAQAIRALVAKSPVATARVDNESKQTSLSGHGDVVVSELELEHR